MQPQCRAHGLEALVRVYAPPKKVRILTWDDDEASSEIPSAAGEAANSATDVIAASTGDASAGESSKSRHQTAVYSASLQGELCNQQQQQEQQEDLVITANACNNAQPLEPPDSLAPRASAATDKKQKREEKRLTKRRWVGSVVEALEDVFTALWVNFIEPTSEFQSSARLTPGATKPGSDATLVSGLFSTEQLLATRESYRIHSQLMRAFNCESYLPDWQHNAAVNEYVAFLKGDQMIHECCLGLFARLGAPQFQAVDQFVDTLRQVWFQPVPSCAEKPRCGYHHVCIGEFSSKARILSGMHNWFKFLVEEEQRKTRILNWWSYQKDLHLVSMKFSMKHPQQDAWFTKPRSSFLVGVPTDFELLLFTVVTMVNPNQDTAVKIKDYESLVVVPRSLKKTGNVVTAYFRESPGEKSD